MEIPNTTRRQDIFSSLTANRPDLAELLRLSALVAEILTVGWAFLVPFRSSLPLSAAGLTGLAFLAGFGTVTLAVFLFFLLGGTMTPGALAVLGLGLPLALGIGARFLRPARAGGKEPGRAFIPLLIAAPLFALNLYIAWKTPIYWPDSINYYDGIGKVIAADRTIRFGFLCGKMYFYGLNSLALQIMHAVSYWISLDRISVLYSGFYISLVLLFADSVSPARESGEKGIRWKSVCLRAALVFCFASTPFVFAMGHTVMSNLPAAAFFFAGIVVWKAMMESGDGRLALLAGVMFGFCSWTRYDGVFFYSIVHCVTLWRGARDQTIGRIAVYLAVPSALMSMARYGMVFFSGSAHLFGRDMLVPFPDLLLEWLLLGAASLVGLSQKRFARALQKLSSLILLSIGIAAGLAFIRLHESAWRSGRQLLKLATDPVWGLTVFSVLLIPFCASLYRKKLRPLTTVALCLVLLRLFLYTDFFARLGISDATITHSGNRVLLMLWPLLIFLLAVSDEFGNLVGSPAFASGIVGKKQSHRV